MRRSVVVLVLAAAVLGSLALAQAETVSAADEFWTTDRVHVMHVRITEPAWILMQPQRSNRSLGRVEASAVPAPTTRPATQPVMQVIETREKEPYVEGQRLRPNNFGLQFGYVKADFECNGVILKDIGFRLRGNSSYNWGVKTYNRPYRTDFNRFVDGQKFVDLAGFHMNNNAFDPSLMREALGYEVFRALGVPAPRTTYAALYLTIDGRFEREFIGIYTLIEQIETKAFLKDRFDSAKGMVLKPWGIRGWPYLGEAWPAYLPRYNPEGVQTPEAAQRTIDFVKLINYADDQTFRREIGQYLNIDAFLRVLAGHVLLSNLDTFLFTGHNHFIYLNPKDDRFYVMPWDLNLAFANFTSAGNTDQLVNLSLLRPHSGEMKLIDRLLAMPEHRQAYEEIIRDAMARFFNPQTLFPRIDALEALVAKAEAEGDAATAARRQAEDRRNRPNIPPRPPRTGWQGRPAITLKDFVTRRIEVLNAQLAAGEATGYTPNHRPQPRPAPATQPAPTTQPAR